MWSFWSFAICRAAIARTACKSPSLRSANDGIVSVHNVKLDSRVMGGEFR